jgi:protein-tyrosine kinase
MDNDHNSDKAARRSQVVDIGRHSQDNSKISSMAELGRMTLDELSERKILHPGMPNKEILNTFREIRTQLLKRAEGGNFVVMVTSITGKAGASFVSTNLGAVLALDKTKTALLIDCNLYDPSLSKLLDVEPDYGLTDYLAEEHLDINDIIYASGIPRLRIIPAGTHVEVGAEYFSSVRMKQFLSDLKQRYPDRFVILDVPAVGLWAEARILTELSDFAVLVVPYGKITESQVVAAIDAIGEDKLAGMVFNN